MKLENIFHQMCFMSASNSMKSVWNERQLARLYPNKAGQLLCYKKYLGRIAIIDAVGEEWMASEGIINCYNIDGRRVCETFPEIALHQQTLKANKDKILPNDTFTIRYEVSEHVESDLSSLQADLSSLLDNQTLSDVVLKISNGKEFYLHKAILAARSSVFKQEFMSGVSSNIIHLSPNISARAFDQAVQFIYYGKVPTALTLLSMNQHALELLTFAYEYKVQSLETVCVNSLGTRLNCDLVVDVLLCAESNNSAQLKAKCVNFIKANLETVQSDQSNWRKLKSKPNLFLELYKSIDLKVKSVIDVLIFADESKDVNLKQKCINFIKANKEQVKQQHGFRALKNNREKQQLLLELLVEFM